MATDDDAQAEQQKLEDIEYEILGHTKMTCAACDDALPQNVIACSVCRGRGFFWLFPLRWLEL